MESGNLKEKNIEKMAKLFPNVIVEVKDENGNIKKAIDHELLLQELTDDIVEGNREIYQFIWPGKQKSILAANSPTNKALWPVKEDSLNWEATENIYIEGDNLEALKLLQESYLNRIRCIYIDPPYNTGNDFIYRDKFIKNKEEYLKESGQADDKGNILFQNTEYNGRYHSDWLNMMYPRLKLSRNLLAENGVIFMSIGKEELSNSIKMLNEIYWESNFIGCVPRITKKTSNSGQFFAPSVDYVLVYAKNKEYLSEFRISLSKDQISAYNKEDDRGRYKIVGFYQASLTLERSRNARYYIECPDGSLCIPPENKRWRCIEDTFKEKLANGEIEFIETGTSPLLDENGNKSKWNVYTKQYLDSRMKDGRVPRDFIDNIRNVQGTKELKELGIPFDFPKPSKLIKYLLMMMSYKNEEKDFLILDFFSGSATTAQAVMELNAEDGGNRKYILVQLPEPIDEKSKAYKEGYKTIAEIGKERIRRAGKKIKEKTDAEIDYGFRVFKII